MTKHSVVGFIGVGNMGGAMAANLLARGWSVHVHDIEPGKAEALAALGAVVAHSALEIAQAADVILIAVVDAAQTEEVLFGTQGIVRVAANGAAAVATALRANMNGRSPIMASPFLRIIHGRRRGSDRLVTWKLSR